MAYTQPYVDATGYHIPTYGDILASEIADYLAVYPSNTSTGLNEADRQKIAATCLKIYDTFLAAQLAYNQRSPSTAVGSGLDAVVRFANITRKPASASTVTLLISGVVGSTITNGVAGDTASNMWDLPSTVTIPSGGSVAVTAVSEAKGAILASPGTITIRQTPTAGWTGVTNPADAVPGLPVESDSQLRARFYLSVALPSRTLLDGTVAAVAAVSGVSRYQVYENFTGSAAYDAQNNPYSLPAHSITAVVEGGADYDVAYAIYANKGIGALPNGTTTVTITDANNGGASSTVGFYRPTYVPIDVDVTVHGLAGYTTAVLGLIQSAITAYLNSLQIGETVVVSVLYSVAQAVMPNLAVPQFSITALAAARHGSAQAATDIAMNFNEVAQGVMSNVSVVSA